MVSNILPNAIVLPTFGNNDFDMDDEPANETTKKEFYSRIFKMWFEDHPTNKKKLNLTSMLPTFLAGGYYRVDFHDKKLTILALNTVMYLYKNLGTLE